MLLGSNLASGKMRQPASMRRWSMSFLRVSFSEGSGEALGMNDEV